jgi:hypothetical protein
MQVRIVMSQPETGTDRTPEADSHQNFEVRLEELARREEEMWHVARTFAVPPGRWNGSRLYKFYQEHRESMNPRSPLVVTLDPTGFCCREQHLSVLFRWKPWLGDMMQSYLRTGVLAVHKDATGDDWLLCCEFFSVLYQPSQVVFETLQAYQNVSSWSDYLSKRCDVAEWVAENVVQQHQTVFVVSIKEDEGWTVEVDQLLLPATCFAALPTLTDFFHDGDHPVAIETRQMRMRADFCGYLEHVLSHVECRFDMELVTLTCQVQRYAPRAVLRIRPLLHPPPPPMSQAKKTRSELPYPVDELVAEDLQRGTLEKLLRKVEARNSSAAPDSALSSNDATPTNDEASKIVTAAVNQLPFSPQPTAPRQSQLREPSSAIAASRKEQHPPSHLDIVASGMAIASGRGQQMYVDGLPFSVIRTTSIGECNQSVTSALTGPFFFDEDGVLKESSELFEATATAADHTWWNRESGAVQSRVKALVDDASTKSPEVEANSQSPVEVTPAVQADVQTVQDPIASKEISSDLDDSRWDWLTSLCRYPSFLSPQKMQPPVAEAAQENLTVSSDSKPATASSSKRLSKLLELQTKVAESRSQKVPSRSRPDRAQEELRVISVHKVVEEGFESQHSVTPDADQASPPCAGPGSPSRSTDSSSSGGRERPETALNTKNRRSKASSIVSATTLQPKSTSSYRKVPRNGNTTSKRSVLKGLFRRQKAEA